MSESAISPPLRVVVADDDSFTTSLVAAGLEGEGFEVFTASTVSEAWLAVTREEPHALVTDLNFRSVDSGATLLRQVHNDFPWVGLVVLTSHRSPRLAVRDTADMPDTVYLVKSSLRSVKELGDAVRSAISGGTVSHSDVAHEATTITVTRAQAEVLRMLAYGVSTRVLAERRGTSVRAAEAILARLYAALGLQNDHTSSSRIEAVTLWQQGRIAVR